MQSLERYTSSLILNEKQTKTALSSIGFKKLVILRNRQTFCEALNFKYPLLFVITVVFSL